MILPVYPWNHVYLSIESIQVICLSMEPRPAIHRFLSVMPDISPKPTRVCITVLYREEVNGSFAITLEMGKNVMKLTRRVLAHSLVRSLVRSSAHSFARIAHSFARSLTRSLAHGKEVYVFEMNASISYNFKILCIVTSKILTERSEVLVSD